MWLLARRRRVGIAKNKGPRNLPTGTTWVKALPNTVMGRYRMADIKVLSTHAIQEVLRELGPAFERANRARLTIDYDPANVLKRKIENGATFDVVITTRSVIDALIAQGKVSGDSCTDIGRSGLGVSVSKGAAKPDLTKVEAVCISKRCSLVSASQKLCATKLFWAGAAASRNWSHVVKPKWPCSKFLSFCR